MDEGSAIQATIHVNPKYRRENENSLSWFKESGGKKNRMRLTVELRKKGKAFWNKVPDGEIPFDVKALYADKDKNGCRNPVVMPEKSGEEDAIKFFTRKKDRKLTKEKRKMCVELTFNLCSFSTGNFVLEVSCQYGRTIATYGVKPGITNLQIMSKVTNPKKKKTDLKKRKRSNSSLGPSESNPNFEISQNVQIMWEDGKWFGAKIIRVAKDRKTVDVQYHQEGSQELGVSVKFVRTCPSFPPLANGKKGLSRTSSITSVGSDGQLFGELHDLNQEFFNGVQCFPSFKGFGHMDNSNNSLAFDILEKRIRTLESIADERLRIIQKLSHDVERLKARDESSAAPAQERRSKRNKHTREESVKTEPLWTMNDATNTESNTILCGIQKSIVAEIGESSQESEPRDDDDVYFRNQSIHDDSRYGYDC